MSGTMLQLGCAEKLIVAFEWMHIKQWIGPCFINPLFYINSKYEVHNLCTSIHFVIYAMSNLLFDTNTNWVSNFFDFNNPLVLVAELI